MLAVRLAADVHDALCAALRQHGRREFVGVLGGRDDGAGCVVQDVRFVPNAADAPDAFAVPAAAFAAAVAAIEAGGLCWLGFVHSHPGAAPALSARDRETLWRDCLQVVVGGAPDAPTLAAFHGDAEGFRPLPLDGAPALERA